MQALAVLSPIDIGNDPAPSWLELARELGPLFEERAERHDDQDEFVAANSEDLRASGLTIAGVPLELGGGGASYEELAQILRQLARHCGSTALALAMHTHQVAIAAWRWRYTAAPTDALLRRVVAERLVLLSSGGSDWLLGSGTATAVDGGFRINARKIFASGSPAADLLLTTAVHDHPQDGPTVLHFAVPMSAVRIEPTWKTLGMRGTGSHDLVIEDFFLPAGAVAGKRPRGKWHPLVHYTAMLAIPLIYSVYVGVAESARDLAVRFAARRASDPFTQDRIGEIENEITAARLAWQDMLVAAASNRPGQETTNRVFIGRHLVSRSVLRAVELAMEAAGGTGFFRSAGLERRFRDAQAARFHPLQDGPQRVCAARTALGLDLDD